MDKMTEGEEEILRSSAGRNTGKPPRDVLWCQRDSTPDIGAHEYGGSPCLTIRAPVLK